MPPPTPSEVADARLLAEHRLIRAIIDAVPDPIFCKDREGRYLLTNSANSALFGVEVADMIGRTVFDIPGLNAHAETYHADDLAVLRSGEAVLNREEPFQRRDGSTGWFLTSKYPLRDASGTIIGLVGIARDISLRRDAERKLTEERNFLQTLIDTIPDLIFFKDCAGRHLHVNAADRATFGISTEQALGKTIREWPIPPDLAALYERDDQQVLATGQPIFNKEEPFQRPGGERGVFLTTKAPIRDASGTIIGLVGIARDITQMRRDQQELECARQRLLDHVENSPLAVIEWQPDFRVERWSGRAEEIFGWQAHEVIGRHFNEWAFVHPDDAAPVAAIVARLTDGRDRRNISRNRNLTKAGEVRHCVWHNSVLRDTGERIVSILSLVEDVTERVAARAEREAIERRLRETQKLESLGVLAGGIAHDFNNLLTGVLGHASLAASELPPGAPARESLEQIELAATRAAGLCKQMLAYSGRGHFVVRALDLNAVIRETTGLLHLSISKQATLTLELAPALPALMADPAQLQQVVMNLVINASEALGDSPGRIRVTTSLRRVTAAELAAARAGAERPAGEYLCLEVADTGSGMAPEVAARIFDPFYTTKFTGRGLGLAAVLGIVRGHHGALLVETAPGRGTTMRVLFPPAEGQAAETSTPVEAPDDWRGSGTVLVIDDEETVRRTSTRILEILGFTVRTAVDGADGLAQFRATPGEFALVLLDLTMPQLGGREVLQAIHALRPAQRVVLMSGYRAEEAAQRFAATGPEVFLEKPFRLAELRAAVRAALAAS
jgi:PAS domain S-box-containing protein